VKPLASAKWAAVKAEIRQVMIDTARQKSLITYRELTASLQSASIHYHSPLLARLLVEIGTEEFDAGRPILPALVVAQQTGIPGKGFFRIAGERGQDVADAEAFWEEEVQRVYHYWESSSH
jgi:hypothetical protein